MIKWIQIRVLNMGKKKKVTTNEKSVDDYSLKTEAVDALTNAIKEGEEAPQKEDNSHNKTRNPYRNDWISRIPAPVKALFFKYWTFGAICFMFYMGLGVYFDDWELLVLITGLATGLVIDFLFVPALRYFESPKGEYHPYVMVSVPARKIWSLVVNIPLYLGETFFVVYLYSLINEGIAIKNNLPSGTTSLVVEPLLYGVFMLAVDMALIGVKDLIVYLIKKNKEKKQAE